MFANNKLLLLFLILILGSCKKGNPENSNPPHSPNPPASGAYKTENVIVVIMDGARYSETWGDTSHQYIPNIDSSLSRQGCINTNFRNIGRTLTVPGHTAITSGHYQDIDSNSNELPQSPSIFQQYIKDNELAKTKAWLICSKGKLSVIADCADQSWKGQYLPSINCGKGGTGKGFRDDDSTIMKVYEVLEAHHPSLVVVNLKDPDDPAHKGNWQGYLDGIRNGDQFVYELWNYLENDSYYRGTTSLIFTNDHGRHLDSIGRGFQDHEGDCEGCQHINLLALGPDFKKGVEINDERSLIDITATINKLLGISNKDVLIEAEVMYELFE